MRNDYFVLVIVAVLSSAVMPTDGVYEIKTLPSHLAVNFIGVPHYIGHTYTRKIVERLGAVRSIKSAFRGLKVGESALCVPINHAFQNRRKHQFTKADQKVSLKNLNFRILTRIK